MRIRRPISPTYATPQEAIAYLASVCDGAVRRDGHGFAAEHVALGHDLSLRRRWRRRHRRKAARLIRYYRRQLERAGFDVHAVLTGKPARASRRSTIETIPQWAPDPARLHEQRFWNGRRWTSDTAPAGS